MADYQIQKLIDKSRRVSKSQIALLFALLRNGFVPTHVHDKDEKLHSGLAQNK